MSEVIVKREHLAVLELFKSIHKNDIDYLICEELDLLINRASADPEQEPVCEVEHCGPVSAQVYLLGKQITAGQKLYAHADPSEVERLRDELVESDTCVVRALNERDAALQKLADAQALLRGARGCVQDSANNANCTANEQMYSSMLSDIDAFLSATAQPAECEICSVSQVVATTDKDHEGNTIEARCPMCAQPAEVKS